MNHTCWRSTALWIAAGIVVLGGLLAYLFTQWAEPPKIDAETVQNVHEAAVKAEQLHDPEAALEAVGQAVPPGVVAVVDPADSAGLQDQARSAQAGHGVVVVADSVQDGGTWVTVSPSKGSGAPVTALIFTVCTALAAALAVLVHRGRRDPATAPAVRAAGAVEEPSPVRAGPDPQVLELQAQRQRMVRGLAELVATLPPEFEWQAENVLNAAGVRAVDADGEVFDPHVHHAVDTEPTPDAALGDTVARTLRRGWVDGDYVVVPARVVVYVAPDRPAVLP